MRWWRAVLLVCLGCGGGYAAAAERPNILLLLADDMGYNDLARHNGNDMPTPRLDRLAAEGLHFSRFYADSTCQPARLALLTGRYPSRAGFRPVGRGIPPEWTTLPEALQALGYRTHHVGKWHLGHTPRDAWPTRQGFDTSFGFLNQWMLGNPVSEGHFPLTKPHYDDPWLMDTDGVSRQYPGHLEDHLLAETVRLIREADRAQPWFIYHAFFAPHNPAMAAERYRQRYPDTEDGRYRAIIHQLDDSVAAILQALEDSGQASNTIVVFTSDNGGLNQARDNNAPFVAGKGSYQEGGIRTFMLWRWPERVQPATTDQVASLLDVYPTVLAALGEVPPAALDGINLLDARQQPRNIPRELLWESSVWPGGAYSVLSPDGRWRYIREGGIGLQLQDAVADPLGRHNAWWRLPVLWQLERRYWDWQSGMEAVAVRFTADGPRGQGRLEGDRFQRTPGLSGFSFGIGIRPAAGGTGGWQSVAEQPGAFRLEYHPREGLRGEAAGLAFAAPVLPATECLAVVVSGYWFLPSLLWGGEPDSSLQLYVNGVELASARGKYTDLADAAFRSPTFIGHRGDGQQAFAGRLGRPQLRNTLMTDNWVAALGGNRLARFSEALCQD